MNAVPAKKSEIFNRDVEPLFYRFKSNIHKLEMQEASLNFFKGGHFEFMLQKLRVEMIYLEVTSCFSISEIVPLDAPHGFSIALDIVLHLLVASAY